ncbi:MAG: site-specific DNA-methyltransferase [Microthrixaceae bacterium]|nr:site-specific DNA-methyltransferase [Microthrixaceae bacterium]
MRSFYSRGLCSHDTIQCVIDGPPSGSYWRVSAEELERLNADGRIWGRRQPSVPQALPLRGGRQDEVRSVPAPRGGRVRQESSKEEVRALIGDAFATPKPEKLMERVISIATDPGDLVLDCFAGSSAIGPSRTARTSLDLSESEPDHGFRVHAPRLKMVVNGEDPGGITEAAEWKGGGGFQHARVGPSMFDLDAETGDVFLAEWATNGAFSEAVAAQLGFEQIDEPPFCGRKGRTRLAVLDGVVGAAEVEFLVAALDERERVIVVGQAFTEDAESTLRTLSPGSRVRHAPQDLLRRGGRA